MFLEDDLEENSYNIELGIDSNHTMLAIRVFKCRFIRIIFLLQIHNNKNKNCIQRRKLLWGGVKPVL